MIDADGSGVIDYSEFLAATLPKDWYQDREILREAFAVFDWGDEGTVTMDELKKIKRVLGKQDEFAPHEVMLVVDATTGGNALQQAVAFHEAVGLTGITITKLDGTASGGIVFAIAKRLGLPLRFIGIGEKVEDLGVFESEHFMDALFDRSK